MKDWKDITPYTISNYISFDRNNISWEYSGKRDMPSIQAEGVAGVCQRLSKHNIAFLADEVGMGKTIQSFGVMSMLWKDEKYKDARILVFAPRREVAFQWEREYKDFYIKHKKEKLTIPSPYNDNVIVLDRLNKKDNEAWLGSVDDKKLVIVKITSLSYLAIEDKSNKNEKHIEEANKLAKEMNKFDLIVIDEAQYFRNKSCSLRSEAAKILFKELSCPVLLMSATPNHSSINDLSNIVSYFNILLSDDLKLWEKIVIRRFRVLSKKGLTKYNYRKEIDIPAFFKQNDENEIFFALYQKLLLKKSIEKNIAKGQEFWRYLEGTEFDPNQFNSISSKNIDNINEEFQGNDHETADDRKILKNLITIFREVYDERTPENPKYETTRKNLIEENYINQTKALVFSRRIPSVREIARGVIYEYDFKMWNMIKKELKIRGNIPNRESFDQKCKRILKPDKEVNEDTSTNEEIEKNDITSKILAWFRISDGKHTEASKFVRRFDTSSNHEGGYRYLFDMDNNKSFWTFDNEIKKLLNEQQFTDKEKIGLSNLIRKASRYSSIGIVELFCCHIYAIKNEKDFFKIVKERWKDNKIKLRFEIIEMIKNFKLFYTKVIGLNEDDLINGYKNNPYEWNEFNNAQPSYAYTASSRNEGVIKRFNSPFFPDILVSTSVLQEGVNLQFFCNKIVHYGIAWTTGDDEQRIGRIDRILSLTERNLNSKNEESFLNIYYPYLEKTHDEKRLGDFLLKKRETEILLDKGELFDQSLSELTSNNISIKNLLMNPQINLIKNDPYPWNYIK
ncbi:SNF2-related protein [Aliarcobacter butzleri]|uniref:SNF2-related protein n=1 Tax=Aliarcobacter butzleri TaxID=28197 RepID=UPI003AF867D3